MGGLTSKPTTQVVYRDAPSASTTDTQSTEPEQTASERASEARESSLLRRDRGRGGTVQTSFRGLLDNTSGTARKTLLGQ